MQENPKLRDLSGENTEYTTATHLNSWGAFQFMVIFCLEEPQDMPCLAAVLCP